MVTKTSYWCYKRPAILREEKKNFRIQLPQSRFQENGSQLTIKQFKSTEEQQ